MGMKQRNTCCKGSKRTAMLMGICLMAGSLSSCGDDTSVTIAPVTFRDLEKEIVKEEDLSANADDKNMANMSDANSEIENEENAEYEAPTNNISDESADEISITISAVGDVTLGNYLTQDYAWSFRQTYEQVQDDAYFFENVYDIFSRDDMTLVNLEGPLTYSEDMREGQYIIKGDPEYVNILTSGSVETASMANNHRLDYKEQGTKDTVEALTGAGIVYAYDNNVGIYETKGIRIGFVAVNEIALGQGVEKFLQEGIALLQEEQVDLILACCHWGIERENYPEEYQKTLGRKCIDWGADLVIGHHPHVLQGIEEYQGKYIVYSLGNFCFGANRNPSDKDTMIFQQTFVFADGEQTEAEARIIPCSVSSTSARNDYKPTPATGEEAVRIINRVNEYSRDFGVQFDEAGNRMQ